MATPMFDGQFRSRPLVSLRGASKKVVRENLLEHAHKEREGRETNRRKNLAAAHFQAGFRGHLVRQAVYSSLRVSFDELSRSCSTTTDLLTLSRFFLVFYKDEKDQERLVGLCRHWLQIRSQLLPLLPDSTPWQLHLSHLLCNSVHVLSNPGLNPALLLRVIEVFLSPASYPSPAGVNLAHSLNSYLAERGFFRCLLTFLKHKVPQPTDAGEVLATPTADILLTYLTRPLDGAGGVVYTSLSIEVLSQVHDPHVKFLVLPQLVKLKLNFQALVESVHEGVVQGGVASSGDLLYSIVKLVDLQLKEVSDKDLVKYFRLLSLLLERSPTLPTPPLEEEEEEEEEDEGVGLVTRGVIEQCLDLIGGTHIADILHAREPLSVTVLQGLCSLCYQLIRLHRPSSLRKLRLFQTLAFRPSPLLSSLWQLLTHFSIKRNFGGPVLCVKQLSGGVPLPSPQAVQVLELLSTFSVLFSIKLFTLHDAEFHKDKEIPASGHMPFSLLELPAMITLLRDIFLALHMDRHLPQGHAHSRASTRPYTEEWRHLKGLVLELLWSLYRRDCRRSFCSPDHWVASSLCRSIRVPPSSFSRQDEEDKPQVQLAPGIIKEAELLQDAPFLFPFVERVRFFNSLVVQDRFLVQGPYQAFLQGHSLNITVHRDYVYEDAFTGLGKGIDIRNKVRVQYMNFQGLPEPGVDGGGVFREFLNDALKTGFDPNRGYFSTTSDGQLYPNAQAYSISDDTDNHYQFLGKLLGKALYEDQLVDLPFASFFLAKLAVGGRGFVDIQHLSSLDPDLYRNLLSLKYHEGSIEDLSLNFTITVDHLGRPRVYELKRDGMEEVVTRRNFMEYINLVAHYKLNVQLHRQYQKFREGLEEVISASWLRLFSQSELQVLISGALVPISVTDLQANTIYKGDYNASHDCIQLFWEVVGELSEKQKQLLLKFVTSCGRPPLLGFKELHPPFAVTPLEGDNHLPTASTCSNLLLLPRFSDKDTMKRKLLYAIQAEAGFELC